MNYLYNEITRKTWILGTMLIFIVLTSCDKKSHNRKPFVWDDEVKQLIGVENLNTWLRKAPFGNELKQAEADKLIFTNAKQVFPFMNRYYDAVEELRQYGDPASDTVIFSAREVLFQDSVWGDLFVGATLLYDDREVFLSDSYLKTGSPFFGGVEAVTDIHRASLYETGVFAKHPKYKTGIYRVWTSYRDYLLGFYQQGQLVFEAVVPLLGSDTLATLNKMKEISKNLGLHVPEWENATVAQLRQVDEPESFWQDPFFGIYPNKFTHDVYLKIKDTPFVQDEKPRKGDYYFAYRSNGGDVSLYTSLQKTEMTKDDFNEANKEMNSYRYSYDDIFYEERPKNGYVDGTAKTYFKDNQFLEIYYSYPEADGEAKKQVHSVLRYVNTRIY
ncbi:hypothetical protein [Sphingobacterium haloxyli]|uniref:Uncharacterized protein n=1 Tax=Sphingobacterium haloxyli TaxID=2100533 RepID=A0A2S9J7S0_9SPHI|nr:hypothetical protein [Sphingobacterium haloxyli]PRD48814.1 hypothetical protein C5745_02405 [Sphingobacterium haloxyli]